MSLSDYDLAKTERLYAHHRCMSTVARLLKLTVPAVRYRLMKAGIEHDSRPGPKPKGAPSASPRRAVWSPADIYSPEA